ncbi:DNA repair protein XRCC1 [Nymphalis io]|uniref:DNA repair protein XRCC1 n=1 Tax=Inachis io TaxID=171585 RepID=UPI0021675F48|nr:DNA repair protein XRCC1 [Nymphalis io]
MPRVKIDYVVSFSSEDPENQANNITEWEVSKKKWLCSKGESSCSIVLQLVKAVKIESISIGAHHAASVEVLVGLSEKPNEPFQVLVPSCMLLSPAESRRDAGVERVRSFSGAQLAGARGRRWDRVRVVCAQPYNKHCKYGLSFVHIHEPESTMSRTFAFGALAADDDEFRPGELFASTRRTTADAQIRQASMDAIKNDSDKYTKLIKIPIAKTTGKECRGEDDEPCSNRRKENLMYTDDDIKPHDKIDQVVQRHKQQKDEENLSQNQRTREHQGKEKIKINNIDRDSKKNKIPQDPQQQVGATNFSPQSKVVRKDTPSTADSSHSKKRKRSVEEPGPRAHEAAVLAGVVFTLSGYENPLRAELRDVGLRLGARYLPGWRGCTHLVCAFPNTPKVREARAGGGRAAAVAGEWLRACAARRRRLPWRWFAVQPSEREAPPADWQLDRPDFGGDSDMDTDDEIEKVLQHQRKKNKTNSPVADDTSAPPTADVVDDANASRESDVTFVRDERVRDDITLDDSDSDSDSDLTDRDDQPARLEKIDTEKELPHFFEGLTFTISDDLDAEYDRTLLVRYIRAYGGLVVEPAAALGGRAQYRVCGGAGGAGGARVRPEWVWRCHRERSLVADGRRARAARVGVALPPRALASGGRAARACGPSGCGAATASAR